MDDRVLPTGTVAFLFTDVEGSTRLWERHGPVMAAALARHDALVRGAIETNRGHVFKTIGDAFCAAFRSPADALAAALAAQRALGGTDWGAVGEMAARVALHVGDAEERDADYFGPTVNRVARLLAAGHGGQVLLSAAAAAALDGFLAEGLAVRDLGERRLKDLTAPERIYQLLAPDLPQTFPPLNVLDARPTNLPVQPTPLLGRDGELEAIEGRLRAPGTRVLTLTGPGGTGKTRLALQAAADLIDDFPHGVWLVDLGATTDPGMVAAEIAGVLGVQEGSAPLDQLLIEYLRDKELLLVLDNFEQLLPAAKQVARLVAGSPKLTVLVTSRAPLRISGEQEYAVPPLGVPDTGRRLPGPEHLLAYPAVELFVQRASAVKPDFALTAENAAAVARICADLDGLPLAIELAAARVRLLPPQALLAKLESRLKVLTGGARDKAERQQTLRNAIAWSVDLLAPEHQALFARLSVFAGGATSEAAEAVCNRGGDLDLFEGMEQLVQHSLVRQEETSSGEPRFRMLASIREFACEQLDARPESLEIRLGHAHHFLAFAEDGRPRLSGTEQAAWLDQLQTEHDNLRLALDTFAATGGGAEELRLADALWGFWYYRGHLGEAATRLERALANGGDASEATRASALDGAGIIADCRRDDARAVECFQAALALFKRLNDDIGVAGVLDNLGLLAQRGNPPDLDAAETLYEEALALRRAMDDAHAIAASLNNIGNLEHLRGRYERAVELYRKAIECGRRGNNPYMESLSLSNLAACHRALGDHDAAVEQYRACLPLLQTLGNHEVVANCLSELALIAVADAKPHDGLALFGAAEELRNAIGLSLVPADQAQIDDAVARARAELGDRAAEAARAAGRELTAEQAIDLALNERTAPVVGAASS